jgi:hypothetical protein
MRPLRPRLIEQVFVPILLLLSPLLSKLIKELKKPLYIDIISPTSKTFDERRLQIDICAIQEICKTYLLRE